MSGVRGLAKPCNSPYLLTSHQFNKVSSALLSFQYKPRLSFFSNASLFFKVRTGFIPFSIKKRRRDRGSVLEVDKFDDEEEEVEVEEEDDNDEDDDDEVVVPLENMKKWLENKPRGFGEGREYDTSVEDKLLEELEKSREAQLANINNLKNNPIPPTPKGKTLQLQKESEGLPSGIRVRLLNLPKKMNIHRDLQSAFKGIPGIVNIVPVVSGNKRTREPICKGIAFVDLKSKEDANRFVQIFSRQSIAFGKVQKQIKCEITNPQLPKPAHKRSVADTYALPRLVSEGDVAADIDIDNSSLQSWEEDSFDESDGSEDEHGIEEPENMEENEEPSDALRMNHAHSIIPIMDSASDSSPLNETQKLTAVKKKPSMKKKSEKVPKLNDIGNSSLLSREEDSLDRSDDKLITTKLENIQENEESSDALRMNHGGMKPRMDSSSDSSHFEKTEKQKAVKKKPSTKAKGEKVPKLNIPGSANRLRIKEKALLTGVFTKYGVNAASTSRDS